MREEEKEKYLEESFEAIGVKLDETQKRQFLRYAELLVQENEKVNLTAITDFEGIVQKHFVDSCALALQPELLSAENKLSLVDIGSGAGFPGVPLKILFPQLKVTLLDSLGKRVRFLTLLIEELGFKEIMAVHLRAEDGAKSGAFRESFDRCVSRAVANLATLSEYCLPYVRIGGRFIAYKSADIREETENASEAIRILGGKKPEIIPFTLPGTELGRSFLVIDKIKPTPLRFPRRAGTAAKEPLGQEKK